MNAAEWVQCNINWNPTIDDAMKWSWSDCGYISTFFISNTIPSIPHKPRSTMIDSSYPSRWFRALRNRFHSSWSGTLWIALNQSSPLVLIETALLVAASIRYLRSGFSSSSRSRWSYWDMLPHQVYLISSTIFYFNCSRTPIQCFVNRATWSRNWLNLA